MASANNNAMYHLAELGGTQITVPVVGKRIKAFKKRYEDEPDLDCMDEDYDLEGAGGDGRVSESEDDGSGNEE